jgi:ATP-dependent DNA helicase RecG
MAEGGLVESRSERKRRSWHLSAAANRRLGEPAACIRRRGFEPLQQEQLILQYVGTHRRITRGEAAELCKLSSDQAEQILARLVRRGDLALHGERKSAIYTLPPKSMDAPRSDMGPPKEAPKSRGSRPPR